jgi:hypothetical protein
MLLLKKWAVDDINFHLMALFSLNTKPRWVSTVQFPVSGTLPNSDKGLSPGAPTTQPLCCWISVVIAEL